MHGHKARRKIACKCKTNTRNAYDGKDDALIFPLDLMKSYAPRTRSIECFIQITRYRRPVAGTVPHKRVRTSKTDRCSVFNLEKDIREAGSSRACRYDVIRTCARRVRVIFDFGHLPRS